MVEITLNAADTATLQGGGTVTLAITGTAASGGGGGSGVPNLLTVMAQNGSTPNLPQDYSYNATDTHMVAGAGNGNAYGIQVKTTGPWGGFQPSCDNGQSISFASSNTITVDISAAAGQQFSMQFLMAGDKPINAQGVLFTKLKNGYERFTCPKALVMTDAVLGDVSGAIYKGAVQSKDGAAGLVFNIDNWGGITV
jgi:hypothetical protein